MFYPQASFYPQTNFAPLSHPNAMYPNNMYAPYGIPQQTPFFTQPFFTQPLSNWQQSVQQLTRQLGIQPPQLGIQPPQLGIQPLGINAFNGIANGAAQSDPVQQFNPALQQAQYGHLLQQLAQYHHLIAQQLAQLAAQTAQIGSGGTYPFAGQFMPSQLSPNFASGITTH